MRIPPPLYAAARVDGFPPLAAGGFDATPNASCGGRVQIVCDDLYVATVTKKDDAESQSPEEHVDHGHAYLTCVRTWFTNYRFGLRA